MPIKAAMRVGGERRKYLWKRQKRYEMASCKVRGRQLDEMESTNGLHGKSLICLMSRELVQKVLAYAKGQDLWSRC